MFPFTLQQLQILKAIATEKTLTKAADILYLSQPSVSKQIKTLEKNLKVVVLHRETKKVSLTEHGKILLRYSKRILPLCDECYRALMEVKKGERTHLIFGASQTIGTYFLSKVITLFRKTYPQINLEIQRSSTRRIAEKVTHRNVDLALISGEIPKEFQKHLLVESFVEDEIFLIVPKSHCLASQRSVSTENLYHLNFITSHPSSRFRKFMDQTLRNHEIDIHRFKIILQLNSMEGIQAAVSLGLGVAFFSSSAMEPESHRKTIKILKIETLAMTYPISMITHSNASTSQALQWFQREVFQFQNDFSKEEES